VTYVDGSSAIDPNGNVRSMAAVVGQYGSPDEVEQDIEEALYRNTYENELRKLRAREQARRALNREQAGAHDERPPLKLGATFLDEPDEDASYRITGLLPSGGRAILAAQYKAGKSTMVGNLIRSLVDGDDFLGEFKVPRAARRVVLLDNELGENMLRRWLRDQGIQRRDGFGVVSLRGRLSTFDILDPVVRQEWASALREIGAEVVILDCLRPILDALGLDENTEAGRFLVAFDELIGMCGAAEAIVVHHMGHSGERSRGSSRLRDWPDVEWRLVREDLENPASPRYFSAFGRDVDVPESLLAFDESTRQLTMSGGSRKKHRDEAAILKTMPAVLEVIGKASEGISGRKIEEALMQAGAGRSEIRGALRLAVEQNLVSTFSGPKRAVLHVLHAA
jgi:hypothetical protein